MVVRRSRGGKEDERGRERIERIERSEVRGERESKRVRGLG